MYQLKLPQLIEEYIAYLATVQQEHQLLVNVKESPDNSTLILTEY